MTGNLFWESIVIILLILLNGFFSLGEMALVAARKFRLKAEARQGNRRAALALVLLDDPDSLFSTVQVGITLIGILTGALGGATLAGHLSAWIGAYDALAPYALALGMGLVILATTYLTLVFGELIPKKVAFSNPERLACAVAPSMYLLRRLGHPAVVLLSASSKAASRLLGLGHTAQPITEEEIKSCINEGVRAGVVLPSEQGMLERVFHLGDRRISSVMTHRSKVVWIDVADSPAEIVTMMAASPYSRFPVCEGGLNEILGVVKARDYMAAYAMDGTADLRSHLHQPLFIQQTAKATALLDAFKSRSRMRFAMVVDEYGDILGIATLNDILEAIVGDLPEVGDDPDPQAVRRADGTWLFDGLIPLAEACTLAGMCIDQDVMDEHDTLAGFILHHLQKLPEMGAAVEWGGFRFEIVDMDGRRIDRILMSRLPGMGNDT